VYTQEQRGEQEVVACYRLATGEPVWVHQDKARFYESNGGPGPRSTPTLHGARAYTFGATGILNALNAATGAVIWKRNAAADTGAKTPKWGFSSSPLIVGDTVVVAAGGKLACYDLVSGRPRWTASAGSMSYSSPHLMTLDGVRQIVFLSDDGPIGISPSDGSVLWRHAWPGSTIIQPALAPDGGLLVTTSDMSGGAGMRRLALTHAINGWSVEEKWTSRGLKPYFNDYAINNGHAYGFDGSILSCIDISGGERKWKGGRYGHGQLILLADQNLLLILSEEGEIALASATPDEFRELSRIPALEGKTWNHPVLTGDVLLVRNGEEMAAFRLPPLEPAR
jgi:outer membrane protein assembly factor BamB